MRDRLAVLLNCSCILVIVISHYQSIFMYYIMMYMDCSIQQTFSETDDKNDIHIYKNKIYNLNIVI